MSYSAFPKIPFETYSAKPLNFSISMFFTYNFRFSFTPLFPPVTKLPCPKIRFPFPITKLESPVIEFELPSI